ncbi:MAG: hypothetical protein FD130_2412, partial [Halothiobacillaceae bacterium]
TGVTACRALIEAAAAEGADAIVVHHGYFWKGEDPRIVGMKRHRLALLLENDISLLAYHLPLDAHVEVGNNVQLATLLGVVVEGWFGGPPVDIAVHGALEIGMSVDELTKRIELLTGRAPLVIRGGGFEVTRVGICTGAAQSYLERAAALGLDAFITGEVSEQTVHTARELGINFFSAGHHATECYGIRALGHHLANYFGVQHLFIDIPNPV